jgi:membrane protein required for colicin V production
MTILDMGVLLFTGWFGYKGFSRGLVTEAISLGTLVLAFIGVKLFHAPVSGLLEGSLGQGVSKLLALVLLFGGIRLAGGIAARKLGKTTKESMVGGIDRILGAGFGALKGLLIATLAFIILALVIDTINGGKTNRPGWMVESKTYPLLNATGEALVGYINQRRNGGSGADTSASGT